MTSIDYNRMAFEEREKFWRKKNVDGIVNLDLYGNTKPRILVIAHEPWIDEVADPLEFNMLKAIATYGKNPQKKKSVLYETAEIVRKIFNVESREDVLFSTAWINVKKQPQKGSKEKRKEVQAALRINCRFIFKQIKQINPDVILAYNVFDGKEGLWNLWKEMRGRQLQYLVPNSEQGVKEIESSYMDPYVEKGVDGHDLLIIDTCHPSARREIIPTDAISNAVHCFLDNEYTTVDSWTNRRDKKKLGQIIFKK